MTWKLKRGVRCAVAGAALLTGCTVLAQGVNRHSVDVSVNAGLNNLPSNDGSTHPEFGGTLGYNFTPHIALLGQYDYIGVGSYYLQSVNGVQFTGTLSGNYQLAGGVLRWTPVSGGRVALYGMGGGGFAHEQAATSVNGTSSVYNNTGVSGTYVTAGAGLSIFAGRSWGFRPEIRWDRQFYSVNNANMTMDDVRGTIGIFYQWTRPYRYY